MSVPARIDTRGRPLAEQRDPRASTQRQAWQSSGDMPMVQEWDAEQAFRLGYLANVVAFRCVQLRANAVASVPIVAGRRKGDLKTVNENAPIARLLGPPPGGPAPRLSASKLIRWTVAQEIVTGRRAWEIESDASGVPVAFWPLVAAQLRPVASKGGVEWFTRFDYGSHHDPVRFKPEDVFYGWDPSGTDFRQAESGLQSSRYNLTMITMADRYGVSFLRNNAVPAHVVTTTVLSDDNLKRAFERQWGAEFGGPDNAGRTMFNYVGDDGDGAVSDSIDIKVLGLSAKDARLVEQRKEAMAEVAISLGVPWSKLDASGRTFDNADVEDRTYWEETVLPDLTDLEDDINMQLAPRLGSDVVWFDLSKVRALQRKVQPVSSIATAVEYVKAGLWTPNEGRIDTGQDPIDDPEYDQLKEIAAPQPVPPQLALPGPPAPLALPDGSSNEVNEDGTSRGAAPEDRAADPEAVEQRRARIWRASDAVARGLESRWERAWRKLFRRQMEMTLSRLTGKRGRQMLQRDGEPSPQVDPANVFDPTFWETETADVVESLYEDVATAGLNRLSLAYGIDFDLSAPFVREFIEARTNQLAGPVTQTTYDAIRQALSDGVASGESIDDLAVRIRTVFTQASETRAVTIARTEVISAYNGAAQLGASTLPSDVVAGQEWIATRDARTREEHASADGQVVAIGSPFTVGGASLAYPGDPSGGASNVVNCRCAIAFLTPEEMADVAERKPRSIDIRSAKVLLDLLPSGGGFDIKWRRAVEEVAA